MDSYGFEFCRISEKLRYEGVSVLNIAMSFPEYWLLRELAENACEWAKNTLYESVCHEYEDDSDPKKRFYFGYDYEFSCETSFYGNGLISAVISVTLKKRKSRQTAAENKLGIVIRESDGAVLPIEAIADKKTVKNYRKSGGESFYLDRGGIILISHGGEESFLCENIVDIWDFKGKKC